MKESSTGAEQLVAGPKVAVATDTFPEKGRVRTMGARVSIAMGQLKRADTVSNAGIKHEFWSDEPEYLGGEDRYPQPLSYVAAGVGFCLLTQVGRYASMLKRDISRAECTVEFDWFVGGSVLKGTVVAGARECRTHLIVNSPESPEDVREVIRLAEQGCMAEGMVRAPVPIKGTFEVNGEIIEEI